MLLGGFVVSAAHLSRDFLAMRFIASLIVFMAFVLIPHARANAATFNLPLAGEVEIVGDLPAPVTITVSMSVTPLGASYWVLDTAILQSGTIDGLFSELQGCVGSACGTLAGFYVCGGLIGCGINLVPGTVISRTGDPISFNVSDASRFLTIETSVIDDSLIGLQLTTELPNGLQLLLVSDPIPAGIAETPLPAGLPLFATGIAALGLAGWRKKRRLRAK